ncbi:MAG: helix-turn-helix transcriptional regulator [Clostridia bacterium]|nr:helix-turn-helix transcriptional regulator [Clostridia bacterium]
MGKNEELSLCERAKIYIKQHLRENISRDSLCNALNTNRTTLSRDIKKYAGKTVTELINSIRLEKSRELLTGGKDRISDIANKCGYSDSKYFTRLFRKEYGVAPLAYRQKATCDRDDELLKRFFKYAVFGRGEAVLTIRAAKNKLVYREAVKSLCLWGWRDQPEPLYEDIFPCYVSGDYERMLCDSFDNPDALKNEIVETLLTKIDVPNRCNAKLLCALGGAARALPTYKKMYESAKAALAVISADMTNRLSEPAYNEDDERYPYEGKRFFTACLGLVCCEPNEKTLVSIFSDIADFFDYSDYPPVPTYQNPLFRMADLYGDVEAAFEIFRNAAKSHRHADKMYEHLPHRAVMESSGTRYTAAEYIAEAEASAKGRRPIEIDYLLSFAESNKSVRAEVARVLLNVRDIGVRETLTDFFTFDLHGETKPLFPLDPCPVLARAREYFEKGSYPDEKYNSHYRRMLALLASCSNKNEGVRRLGLDMLEEAENSGDEKKRSAAARYGIPLAYGVNYRPDDESRLEQLLFSGFEPNVNSIILQARINLNSGKNVFPDKLLSLILELTDPWNTRLDLSQKLADRGKLTREMCKILKYDCCSRTRKLALQYYR